jgi:hypothetical protein
MPNGEVVFPAVNNRWTKSVYAVLHHAYEFVHSLGCVGLDFSRPADRSLDCRQVTFDYVIIRQRARATSAT